jgi:hypothetical protein
VSSHDHDRISAFELAEGELSDDELDAVSGGIGGLFRPISPPPVRPSFEDPLTAFEDPLTAFEDPLTAIRRP